VTMHHIVSDGWSISIFVRELSALYRAYCLGGPADLEPLPIQYADYAQWQRRWLSEEVLSRQGTYWQRALQGAPSLLELRRIGGGRRSRTSPGRMCPWCWGEADGAAEGAEPTGGLTLFMTVLAGWAAGAIEAVWAEDCGDRGAECEPGSAGG